MHTIRDRIATTQVRHNLAVYQFVTVTVWEVDGHGWRVVCSCVCPVVVVVFGGGDDVFASCARAHHEWFGCCSSFVRVYFRAGHSREATVRTNDETTSHSDALQRLMCAKSSL